MKLVPFLILCSCLFASTLVAQQKKKSDKYPSYFGFIGAPVIPNNFVGATATSFQDTAGRMFTTFNNTWGYTFGAIARIGLSKSFAIETGITQVHRNYRVDVAIPDSAINCSQQLSFVNYDVPINGLVYVQMAEKWYMNALLGLSINQYPTDVRDSILPGQGKKIWVEGRRTNRTYFAANAGIGWEYRTLKKGTFYLGFSAKVPFKPVIFGVTIFNQSGTGNKISSYKPITAGYFTIDFRYFFPTPKKKDFHPLKGPIE
jgi:hypothetical protein